MNGNRTQSGSRPGDMNGNRTQSGSRPGDRTTGPGEQVPIYVGK